MNHLYFGPDFIFWGTTLGCFSQCFLKIFRRRPTLAVDIFTQIFLLEYNDNLNIASFFFYFDVSKAQGFFMLLDINIQVFGVFQR